MLYLYLAHYTKWNKACLLISPEKLQIYTKKKVKKREPSQRLLMWSLNTRQNPRRKRYGRLIMWCLNTWSNSRWRRQKIPFEYSHKPLMITLNPAFGFLQLIKLSFHARWIIICKYAQLSILALEPSDLSSKLCHLGGQWFDLASSSK